MSWICRDCNSINEDTATECEVCGCSERYVAPDTPAVDGPMILSAADVGRLPMLSGVITVPDCFTVIGEEAFADNRAVKSVILPPTVVEIRARAFYNCSALLSVLHYGQLAYLGPHAFGKCYMLGLRLHASNQDPTAYED